MRRYREPEGYLYDERTRLYYSQIIAVDENGEQVQMVTWFNAENGKYSQYTYPIEKTKIPQSEQSSQQIQYEEETKVKPLLFLALLLIVCGGIFLCSNSFFLKKPISKEELIESVQITDENSKTISFQDYDATLNDIGFVSFSGETQIFLEDE
ncbi:MAG: hypothetical protein PHY47_01970 [Lachnospiraceae bacterium]|nr:hypothetical protein [Lachnospiraceae bacterium]